MKRREIAIAMSGGVDSSVAAAVLIERGFDPVGVTFRLVPGRAGDKWDRAAADAGKVCEKLGMPHLTADFSQLFHESVLKHAADCYARGLTPNPCIECNRSVKFGAFPLWARDHGIQLTATGHYARITRYGGEWRLNRGLDHSKDQSYVLWGVNPGDLERIRFPLGRMTKRETRQRARALGLEVHDRPGSQELCFAEPGRHPQYLSGLFGPMGRPGPILTSDGRHIGDHKGLEFYTVGQRRGLGVAWPHPLYVVELDRERNAVVAGPDSALFASGLLATAHWLTRSGLGSIAARVKIRYNSSLVKAEVHPRDNEIKVRFSRPQRAVTPGQSVVIYGGNRVLAGGIILAALS